MRTRYAILASLMIFAIILAACRPAATPTTEAPRATPTSPPAPTPEKPAKLGVLTVLTGGAGFLGNEQLNAAKVIVAQFNAETGLNIEIVEVDDMLSPDAGKLGAEL